MLTHWQPAVSPPLRHSHLASPPAPRTSSTTHDTHLGHAPPSWRQWRAARRRPAQERPSTTDVPRPQGCPTAPQAHLPPPSPRPDQGRVRDHPGRRLEGGRRQDRLDQLQEGQNLQRVRHSFQVHWFALIRLQRRQTLQTSQSLLARYKAGARQAPR